ncbi:MAG: hypothetical protein FJ096_05990 [Deltaproteobacteria bacterium]|nr:hypothetical protein [Deltaproteobacteria bacterium]
MLRRLAVLLLACALFALARPGMAWTENRITADEVRVEVDATGVAVVEHRLAIRINGNESQRTFVLKGVDADAAALPNAYVVPAADAHATTLASAVPVKLALVEPLPGPDGAPLTPDARDLQLTVDDDKGILRGAHVFVFRYRTDLKTRGLMRREGAMMLVEWQGPDFGAGLDNLRVTFAFPPAPTPPRPGGATEDPDGSSLISEVRRSSEADEIELVRTYAPEGSRVVWLVRADPRSIVGLASPIDAAAPPPPVLTPVRAWLGRAALHGTAAALVFGFGLLVYAKGRQVKRLAAEARATMRPALPLPEWLRVPLAALSFVGGLLLQLVLESPVAGSLAIVAASWLAAHGVARADASASLRGPGRWLAVSEREALVELPPPRGAPLDVGTRAGKALLFVLLVPFGVVAALLARTAPEQAMLVGLDSIAVLSIFGTGLRRAMPADLAVEPAPFFRKLVAALRKRQGAESLRLVPRVRIPTGEVDADELRLLVVPRLPLRGFGSIEIAMTYAIGLGARVAMPEVLLRVVAGSPCDLALATLSRHARITPGRKADERVFSLSPRLPTVRMTAEIVGALAARVTDADAVRSEAQRPRAVAPRPGSGARARAA